MVGVSMANLKAFWHSVSLKDLRNDISVGQLLPQNPAHRHTQLVDVHTEEFTRDEDEVS